MAEIKFQVPTQAYKAATEFEHTSIPVQSLNVDRLHYQRFIYEKFVQFLVLNFNPIVLGQLLVSRREDGTYYVIDGQQRLAALRRIGWTHAPCVVVHGLTVQDEARMFYQLDTQRHKLNAMDLFRAKVTAEDEEALRVLSIINETGWQVDLNSQTWWTAKPDYIRAVDACALSMRRYGEHTLRVALSTLREAWPNRVEASSRPMILGISRLHFTFNDVVKVDRLVSRLSSVTPNSVLADAKAYRSVERTAMDDGVGRAMYQEWAKHLRRDNYPAWETRKVVFSMSGTRVQELAPVKATVTTEQE